MATTTTTSSAPTSVPTAAPVPPTSAGTGTATTNPDGSAKKTKYGQQQQVPQTEAKLSTNELERVTEVFKMYETGLREATIYPKDLAVAMKALGLNPTETEIQDLINEVERNGFIYYPAFCRVIMRKLREDDEENFRRELFRVLVGPKKYPDGVPAQLYNINKEVLTFEQFKNIMTNLPEFVDEAEVKTMFAHADKDKNGFISYREFTLMCKVPEHEPIPLAPGGASTSGSLAQSMTNTVVTAVNGMLKGGGATSTTAASSLASTSATPVATVVTVTSSK